jgi:hypothetical protein
MALPKLDRPTVQQIVDGNEDSHFNPACADSIDQIVGPVLGLEGLMAETSVLEVRS